VVFRTLAVADAGEYQIRITSLEGAGPYSVQLLLNAAGEEERFTGASNDTWASAQDLSSSVVVLPDGGDRLAVVGQTGTGTLVNSGIRPRPCSCSPATAHRWPSGWPTR
jgi:hypothetical protein